MKISVTKDNSSGVWNVATDLIKDEDPLNLLLDAAIFDQDNLAKIQPQDNGPLFSNSSFELVRGAKENTNSCVLKIHKSVAAFDSGSADYRNSVIADFDDFLQKANAHEKDFIRPGAGDLLRKFLAGVMPASFAESLYFHYGYSRRNIAAKGGQRFCVDLQAGMRLRLDIQFSQLVLPGATSFDPLVNGFVPAGQASYHIVDVSSNGVPQLGFDAFLAANPLTQVDPGQGGAGGIVDLLGARRRYYRICYPAQFVSSDSAGFQGTRKNVTMIGADDIATLESATTAYYLGGVFSADTSAVFFRGRTTAVPEIACFLNDNLVYVPVGATVRQLFGRFSVIPRLAGFVPPNFPYRRLRPDSRFVQRSIFGDLSGAFPDTYTTISFQSATVAAGPQDAYDLPVLAGDSYKLD